MEIVRCSQAEGCIRQVSLTKKLKAVQRLAAPGPQVGSAATVAERAVAEQAPPSAGRLCFSRGPSPRAKGETRADAAEPRA
jgi:hypothetical protein